MRHRDRVITIGIWVSVIAGCLWLISSPAAGQPLKKVRFVQSGLTSSSWPIYVAQQRKIFAKNGLAVESIIVRGSPNVVRAVASNSVPLGRINPDHVIGAIEKGARLRIVGGNQDKVAQDLMARPEINGGADLKGRTIAVSTLTGGTTVMVEEVLEKTYGLKKGEYKYLVVGTSSDRYAALKGGSVDATIMGAPFTITAAQEGFRKLIALDEVLGPIQFSVDFAHQDYIRDHREEIVRYLQSTIEATEWLYDPRNKAEALAIHMQALKSTRATAEEDYRFTIEAFQSLTRGGAVATAAWNKTMELRAKSGLYTGKTIPAMGTYVDPSIVQEAQRRAGYQP
jgi:ABC-type nitrate/sulfonate/bicarbonate transport system substrate-binding protein